MEKARDMGAKALAITGNIDFYGKSGFVVASTKGIRYADADPEGFEAFEARFPPKEKKKLPGQIF